MYWPPSRDVKFLQEMREAVHSLHIRHPNSTIWFAGDVNLPEQRLEKPSPQTTSAV
ncbi:hypothetical protein DPMN_158425 [Dreissena polymorpha]|uniref:Uncharacterized protein n=1 Tax=Dreissena polymorpha TaxID=45954 RepID=A0A9D4IPS5_DREPO|nr:hypothetical protein DPMN_158425 [Dreissena polymorpha]